MPRYTDLYTESASSIYLHTNNRFPWNEERTLLSENYLDTLANMGHYQLKAILNNVITIHYESKDRRLYLIPYWWQNSIPIGYEFIDYTGNKFIFDRSTSQDYKYSFRRAFGFGIIRVDKRKLGVKKMV